MHFNFKWLRFYPRTCLEQLGLGKGRRYTDTIFTLQQISEKAVEHRYQINIAFIDYEKAFDRVNSELLWETIENYGIKGTKLVYVRAMYRESERVVRTSARLTLVSNYIRIKARACSIIYQYHQSITKAYEMSRKDDRPSYIREIVFAVPTPQSN